MAAYTFVAVVLLAVSGALAQSSIPLWDREIKTAGYPSYSAGYYYANSPASYYSAHATFGQLRYISWHEEAGSPFVLAWTPGCEVTTGYKPTCGIAPLRVSSLNPFEEIRWGQDFVYDYQATATPVSVDVGNEIAWTAPGFQRSNNLWSSGVTDYMTTLWMVDSNHDVWYMWCGVPVLSEAFTNVAPNAGPTCRFIYWVKQTSGGIPANAVFVSSGGFQDPAPSVLPSVFSNCNVVLIDAPDSNTSTLYFGGRGSGPAQGPGGGQCWWNSLSDANIVSAASGTDVIFAIDDQGNFKSGMLAGQIDGLLGSWTDSSKWSTMPALPAGSGLPHVVDAHNSTIVYVVDTNQQLFRLSSSGASWTPITLPTPASSSTSPVATNQVLLGPVPAPGATHVAALSVGPGCVYVTDNDNYIFRLPH